MHWRESAMWHWTGVWLLRRRGWVWNSLGNCWNEMHLGPAEWRSLHRQWNRAWEVCQKLPGTTCNLLWLKRMLQRSYMQKAISLGSFHHMPGTCSHLCTTWWKLWDECCRRSALLWGITLSEQGKVLGCWRLVHLWRLRTTIQMGARITESNSGRSLSRQLGRYHYWLLKNIYWIKLMIWYFQISYTSSIKNINSELEI